MPHTSSTPLTEIYQLKEKFSRPYLSQFPITELEPEVPLKKTGFPGQIPIKLRL